MQICLRMAVQKNMDARNFGVAARLLSELLSQKGLPDQANLELRRKKCEEVRGSASYCVPWLGYLARMLDSHNPP